jgi:hypothetical protein
MKSEMLCHIGVCKEAEKLSVLTRRTIDEKMRKEQELAEMIKITENRVKAEENTIWGLEEELVETKRVWEEKIRKVKGEMIRNGESRERRELERMIRDNEIM